MGVGEKIQDILNSYCSGGYGGGVIGQANVNYLSSTYDFIKVERIYRLGDLAVFVTPVKDSRLFGQFLEELAGLEDYPIIDEQSYYDLISGLEHDECLDIIKDNGLEADVFWSVFSNGDYPFSVEQDYVYPDFDMTELVAEVRTKSQTFTVHYGNTEFHYPEACEWCADTSLPSSQASA